MRVDVSAGFKSIARLVCQAYTRLRVLPRCWDARELHISDQAYDVQACRRPKVLCMIQTVADSLLHGPCRSSARNIRLSRR